MSGRLKHMERSHRSYHNKPDFIKFNRKAQIRQMTKTKQGIAEMIADSIEGAVNAFKTQKKGDK